MLIAFGPLVIRDLRRLRITEVLDGKMGIGVPAFEREQTFKWLMLNGALWS
jgi:hypothetical protein